jgi:hypothetical protein
VAAARTLQQKTTQCFRCNSISPEPSFDAVLTDKRAYLQTMVQEKNSVLTIRFVGSLLPMGGVLCANYFDPRPIGGRNMAISKIWAKIWPKLDFFQITPVWPKIGFWSPKLVISLPFQAVAQNG